MRSRLGRGMVWLLAVAASAAGIWISYELTAQYTAQHYQISRGEATFLEEFCDAYQASSCQKVSASHWGRFPFGAEKDEPSVPTSELGLLYFTVVFCWFVLIGGCTASRWWAHLILTAATALGLGSSVYLEYVMWKGLDYWCPLCLAAHVGSLLLFVFALLLWPHKPRPTLVPQPVDDEGGSASEPLLIPGTAAPAAASRPWPHWWMLVVTPLVGLSATGLLHFLLLWQAEARRYELADQQKDRLAALYRWENRHWQQTYLSWGYSPQIEIATEGEPVRGPENARHTIVIFSDFDCPACARFETWFKKYIRPILDHPSVGGAKVIFKHFPIFTECNAFAFVDSHPFACTAARAVEAARIVGGDEAFWKMHDLLFERRAQWKKAEDKIEAFVELAGDIGLDADAFRQAMDSPEADHRIRAHTTQGENLGQELVAAGKIDEDMRYWIKVHGTPSIYIDNRRLYTRGHTTTWRQILGYRPLPEPKRGPSARATSPAGGGPPPGRGSRRVGQ